MHGGDQLRFRYSNISVPWISPGSSGQGYNFEFRNKGSSPAFGDFRQVGHLAVTVQSAATVTVSSSQVSAGGSEGVSLSISGPTSGKAIVITPPIDWTGAGVTLSSGSAAVAGGTQATPAITVTPTSTGSQLYVNYNFTVGTEVGPVNFTATQAGVVPALPAIQVDVVADGSGIISFAKDAVTAAEYKIGGLSGQTIDMYYTAVGNSTDNANMLSGGTLELEINSSFAYPSSSNFSIAKIN